ncbi:MAG: class I SAM-dependent methyltransferase [Nitrospirae bacterium]|nr:class I SAM-dependent methyltransferase [Nitrospirota bacterium]
MKGFVGQTFRSRLFRDVWNEGRNATITYKEMVSHAIRPGMRILHAGCGWDKHSVTRPYRDLCQVVGIDLDPRAGSRFHSEFYLDSISNMPFEDESFDLILCENVMEHLDEPTTAFREMARVLKPGGTILMQTPNLYSYKALAAYVTSFRFHLWAGRMRYGRGREADMYPTRYRCNTAARLVRTARASGFHPTEVEFVSNGPTWFVKVPVVFELFHLFHLAIAQWRPARQLRCALILKAKKPASHVEVEIDLNHVDAIERVRGERMQAITVGLMGLGQAASSWVV